MKTKLLLTITLGALGAVGAACSGDDTTGATSDGGTGNDATTSNDTGTTGNDSGTTNGDSSTGGDGATESGGSGKTGRINVSQTAIAGGTSYFSSVAASFSAGGGTVVVAGNCTTTTQGSCTVLKCTAPPDAGTVDAGEDGGDAGPVVAPNAGDITVSGPKFPDGGSFVLTPGDAGTYQGATGPTTAPIFAGGDNLTASAAGKDVPAFSNQTLVAPSDLDVTAPTFTASVTTFKRSENLAITWTAADGGAATGTVNVLVSAHDTPDDSSTIITCAFPAAGGTGSVPTAALQDLPQANGTTINGFISIIPEAATPFTAGDWNITFSADATGASGAFVNSD